MRETRESQSPVESRHGGRDANPLHNQFIDTALNELLDGGRS